MNATTGATGLQFRVQDHRSGRRALSRSRRCRSAPDGTRWPSRGRSWQVNGQAIPRLALINTGGALGATATLANFSVPLLNNNCSKQHDYINGLDFSPDSSFFVISDTGFGSNGQPGLCDATARFKPSAPRGTNVAPAWVNYTGGDSFRSVVVAGSMVYVGGHERWLNNECGSNHVCELEPGTGRRPRRDRREHRAGAGVVASHDRARRGVQSLSTYPAGTFPAPTAGCSWHRRAHLRRRHALRARRVPADLHGRPGTGRAHRQRHVQPGLAGRARRGHQGVPTDVRGRPGQRLRARRPVDLATCNNANEQNWTVGSDGTIQVNGLCLDTQGGATAAGTPLVAEHLRQRDQPGVDAVHRRHRDQPGVRAYASTTPAPAPPAAPSSTSAPATASSRRAGRCRPRKRRRPRRRSGRSTPPRPSPTRGALHGGQQGRPDPGNDGRVGHL